MSFARSSFEGCGIACANPSGNAILGGLLVSPAGVCCHSNLVLLLDFLKCLETNQVDRGGLLGILQLGVNFTLCFIFLFQPPLHGIFFISSLSPLSHTQLWLYLCAA